LSVLVGTAVYEREKSSVFCLPRKTGSNDEARTDSGRQFQTGAAAAGKARSPMVARRVRGPTSADADADGDADAAVEARIRIGWNKFRQLVPLLTNKDVSSSMRGKL